MIALDAIEARERVEIEPAQRGMCVMSAKLVLQRRGRFREILEKNDVFSPRYLASHETVHDPAPLGGGMQRLCFRAQALRQRRVAASLAW